MNKRQGWQWQGWRDSIGTMEEIEAKAQRRQEAAIKRERAMAYAFSNQVKKNLCAMF